MAFTVSHLAKDVTSKRISYLRVTADSAEGTVMSGLDVIEAIIGVGYQSCTTGGFKVKMNVGTTATVAVGQLAITGVANGDVMFITVVGR